MKTTYINRLKFSLTKTSTNISILKLILHIMKFSQIHKNNSCMNNKKCAPVSQRRHTNCIYKFLTKIKTKIKTKTGIFMYDYAFTNF